MSRYHDDRTQASDPGRVSLSLHRFRRLEPAVRGLRGWLWRRFLGGREFEELLDEHLRLGDSRAACVVSTEPLLVAAYTDELDCVAMLGFPAWLLEEHGLRRESRLLTVNTYETGLRVVPDLVVGSDDLNRYSNVFPAIADFLSDDLERIEARKREISEDEWRRCETLGREYLQRFPRRWRDGSPLRSRDPATGWPGDR